MTMLTLAQAAKIIDAELVGNGQISFDAVAIDSRSIASGDLFVALEGPNFDGHKFVTAAADQGAVAAIVSKQVEIDIPQLIVSDTRLALGRLAAAWRSKFQGQVIGVTGSNGKTTVKEMLARIMSQKGLVLATEGNLNNDIGVPLMLLRLKPEEHSAAVIEMGANHVGEIAYLTRLVRPDVAVVTNAATAHLEGFGSLEDVARAKGEIWQGLQEGGTAIVNQDDEFAGYWAELVIDCKQLGFGMLPTADVNLADGGVHWEISANGYKSRFNMHTPVGKVDVAMNLAGRHNVMNALAATASALAAGVGAAEVQAGLESMEPVKGRLQPKVTKYGQLLIDDSYNANPHSVRAAIDVLLQAPGEKILVMGDMAELGVTAAQHHFNVGEEAREKGIDQLLACGDHCQEAVRGFGDGATCFSTQQSLINCLSEMLADPAHQNTVLLIKGSRGAAMDNVVDALVSEGT